MSENQQLAHELDRVMRSIDAHMHKSMPAVDRGRIGPMGSLLLMQLESMEPCSIQALAIVMKRDNSQLTRLIRDLERKRVLRTAQDENDGRTKAVTLTDEGHTFLLKAKETLTAVVEEVVAPLNPEEKRTLLTILSKL